MGRFDQYIVCPWFMAPDFSFGIFTGTTLYSHSPIYFMFFQSKHIFSMVQKEENPKLFLDWFFLNFWCLMPLSATLQLYRSNYLTHWATRAICLLIDINLYTFVCLLYRWLGIFKESDAEIFTGRRQNLMLWMKI